MIQMGWMSTLCAFILSGSYLHGQMIQADVQVIRADFQVDNAKVASSYEYMKSVDYSMEDFFGLVYKQALYEDFKDFIESEYLMHHYTTGKFIGEVVGQRRLFIRSLVFSKGKPIIGFSISQLSGYGSDVYLPLPSEDREMLEKILKSRYCFQIPLLISESECDVDLSSFSSFEATPVLEVQ